MHLSVYLCKVFQGNLSFDIPPLFTEQPAFFVMVNLNNEINYIRLTVTYSSVSFPYSL